MGYYIVKITVTTALVVFISEIAKRSSFVGAIMASIPLISVLAMFWLYIDTKDVDRVGALAMSIFWLVLPSLVLFLTLSLLLKRGLHFYLSTCISVGLTVGCYILMVAVFNHYNIEL